MPELKSVRPAEVRDALDMRDLLNEIIAVGGTTAYEDAFDEAGIVGCMIEHPALLCCHVAVDDADGIAGFQFLKVGAPWPEGTGSIATFARQTPRVRGVGTALLQKTVAAARAAGLHTIEAQIRGDNRPGLGYYTKMGFIDNRVVTGIPLKDGTPVDRVVKLLSLD
ncbi:MAG: GNAT family N-acetyltransferase [Pseudomonadota bacterium]